MMITAAFSLWQGRIAPVFDESKQIQLVQVETGQIVRHQIEYLPELLPIQRALALVNFGVDELICGAISKPLQQMIEGQSIKVIPFISGDLHEVVSAWLEHRLMEAQYIMPGCCRRRMIINRELETLSKLNPQPDNNCGRNSDQTQRPKRGRNSDQTQRPKCGRNSDQTQRPKCGRNSG
jgi:predicted Fe-Mo cluster-binding NifX family protein